jgi:hypothetical protein
MGNNNFSGSNSEIISLTMNMGNNNFSGSNMEISEIDSVLVCFGIYITVPATGQLYPQAQSVQ